MQKSFSVAEVKHLDKMLRERIAVGRKEFTGDEIM